LSIANTGKKMKEETKNKLSKYFKGRPNNNISKSLIGRKLKPETIKKLKSYTGNKRYNYMGGSKRQRILKTLRSKPEICEICGEKGIICFDHNHTTGNFRGWICKRCNSVLGFVKDNHLLLKAMITYLITTK